MESNLFTPKEKYHISSTILILFLITRIMDLIMPLWSVRGYTLGVVILFGYTAWTNYIKLNKQTS